ncbi:MAG: hypothetical protein CMF52_01820 [Legionellales bacterium]|nr:hypothetical protein [Legionellales bacterium]HAV93399.1 hypothetical protein [Pseudomonadota bacterium]|tara:strand:+ start:236 stop:898 length:663 start_codon:yes stop_codon:yes gene_type:complete
MVNKHSFQYWRDAGCSEAIWASSTGDLKTLEKLVADQKDIETGDYDRRTPLHLASAEGHTDVVKFLLDHGVEPSPDRWGGYPISDAKAGDHKEIVELFNNLSIDYTDPHHVVSDSSGPTDTSVKIDDDMSVIELLWAATDDNVTAIGEIVGRGIDISVSDYDDRTALHLAAAEGNLDAVRYLVGNGHHVNVRDRWGATPLDEAIREKRSDVIDFLQGESE